MTVTKEEVLRIAELAKLQFDPAELEGFVRRFQRILAYVEKLKEVEVEGIEATSQVLSRAETAFESLRDDAVRQSLPGEEALSGAPETERSLFRVPKVIG